MRKKSSTSNQFSLAKPFLKWAGGKKRLVRLLYDYVPRQFNIYHEPFLGSGALFFYLYSLGRIKRAILSDINQELITTYTAVRDHVEEVLSLLRTYPHSRDFYYDIRDKDPSTLSPVETAARMIYLNKTCYNGLYRVNRQGKFNVPFGRYKSPKYYDPEALKSASKALQKAELICTSFETVLDRASDGDFVYFDPPYVPSSPTARFVEYTPGGFDINKHILLKNVALELHSRNVHVLISNSDTKLVKDIYIDTCFNIELIQTVRSVSCKANTRGSTTEVVITNSSVPSLFS
jgi:DNA adenine methylase